MVNAHEEKKVILISGTSTGFGRVLAVQALERGYLVIATARKVEAIADLKERGAAILPLDVTASTETLTKFAADAYQI
jgi:NADP-dependent 3-hydroxy acid dehydrogenase YdfG